MPPTKADIRSVRSLADKRAREEQGLFVAEGRKLVCELLDSHLQVERIFATEGCLPGAEAVSPREMERMSHLQTPADCLALVRIPRYDAGAALRGGSLRLALDRVQNPGNMGTIIRLADWFGIGDILCSPDTADCFSPKVVQATMGAILRVRVHYLDLPEALRQAREAGSEVCGTFLEGENIYRARLDADAVVLLGNEGRGIGPAAAAQVGRRLFIPPWPEGRNACESLNVAMAAAIVCSEFRRR